MIKIFHLIYKFLQSSTSFKNTIFSCVFANCHHRPELRPHKYVEVCTMHGFARSKDRIKTTSNHNRIADHASVLGP